MEPKKPEISIPETLLDGDKLYAWFDEHKDDPGQIIAWSEEVVKHLSMSGLFDDDIMYGIAYAYTLPSARALFWERQLAEGWSKKQKESFDQEIELLHSKRLPKGNVLESLVPSNRPILLNASDIQPLPINWLWEPYLARGMLAMIDGDPGVGKSLFTVQLAACISRGWPLPDQQGKPTLPVEPSRILFLIAEESHSHTFRPRLDTCGADVDKIKILTGFLGYEDEERAFTFQYMDVLRTAVETVQPSLVVIDPIQAYVGGIDIHRANETRPFMTQLKQVAEDHNVAIVCLRHLAKGSQSGGKALHRGLGSVDFAGAARTVLMVEQHPLEATKAVVMQTKSNISRTGRTQIFSKADGFFQWAGVTRATADTLGSVNMGPDPHAFNEALFWLEDYLLGGIPQPSQDVMDAAEEAGISIKTLKRVKKHLDIKSIKNNSVWYWKLSSLDIIPSSTPPRGPGPLGSLGSLDSLGLLDPLEENQTLKCECGQGGQTEQVGQEVQGGQVGQVLHAHTRESKSVPKDDDLEALFQIEDENAEGRP